MLRNTDFVKQVEATRIVISFVRAGGDLSNGVDYGGFRDWVKSLGYPEEDEELLLWIADNGKFEFEEHARRFLENR